jgi:hypothetical protein
VAIIFILIAAAGIRFSIPVQFAELQLLSQAATKFSCRLNYLKMLSQGFRGKNAALITLFLYMV